MHGAELRAAIELWEEAAAFAWDQFLALGRGVVLIDQEELFAAQRIKAGGGTAEPTLAYVPLTHIPPGADFRRPILEYDPRRQIVLLVRSIDGDEAGADDGSDTADLRLYVIEASEQGRPTPEKCVKGQGAGVRSTFQVPRSKYPPSELETAFTDT
jgi:hypothetical protein